MKTLVAYFSKTGNTKKVAEKIAKELKADIDEIIDKENKGEEHMMKKEPIPIGYKKDPSKYDLAIIGSPVWAFSLPPAPRSYLSKNKFNKVAFFCTYALMKGRIFGKMKNLSKEPLATLKVHMKRIEESEKKIKEFCDKLK